MMTFNRKGQSTVEYAIIVAVIISALLVMQFWMRRGVMGKLRESTDQIGEQFNPFEAELQDVVKGYNADRDEDSAATGSVETTINNEQQTQTGAEVTADLLDNSQLFQ